MPRVADNLLESVVYLYGSVADAQTGEMSGGTGFLVSLPLDESNLRAGFLYAVTNSHVIREGGASVLRVNKRGGGVAIMEVPTDAWHHHPVGDDVAVCQLGLSAETIRFMSISRGSILTREDVEHPGRYIGIGDDVFFVGRFAEHEGRATNLPSLRFGTIAQMPWEPVLHERGIMQECFLVEARSLSGFSGSPVYLYYALHGPGGATAVIGGEEEEVPPRNYAQASPWYLLGIDFAHLSRRERVRDAAGEPVEDYWVRSNTGMMTVVPSWKLLELLDDEELVAARKEQAERHKSPRILS